MYENKLVIVSGCSRGVGYDIAQHMLCSGARVFGLSRSACDINDPRFEHFRLDISDLEAVSKIFSEFRARKLRFDYLINNAGVSKSSPVLLMKSSDALEIVKTNLLGAFVLAKESAKLMKKNGRVIAIGSIMAEFEPIGGAIYAASKSALHTFTNVLAKELAPLGITCNTIGLSLYQTEMLDSLDKKIDEVKSKLTIKRVVDIDELANVVDFYLNEKSSGITAQCLYFGGVN